MNVRLILLLLLSFSVPAFAHKASDSYLSIDLAGEEVTVRWDIALRDLDEAVGLDGDDDGAITWGELQARQSIITAYASNRLHLNGDGRECVLIPGSTQVDQHTDGTYAVLGFRGNCGAVRSAVEVDYGLLFDIDPQHRGLLKLSGLGGSQTAIFGPADHRRRFELAAPADSVMGDFIREGAHHIWIGYDHILFLLSLLLPAVLIRTGSGWRRIGRFRPALLDVVRVVTAFTVAHSVSLSLAALGFVDLPSRWVESAIAASVVLAALNNLVPLLSARRVAMAFGFGLIHGLGFASVLSDLGLAEEQRLLSLLSFNLGVELGQLAIVAGFLPAAFLLSRSRVYEWAALKAGSFLIVLVAGVWLAERAFDLQLGFGG